MGTNVLVDLQRKAQVLNASGQWPRVHYALFSKSGFTKDLRAVAAEQEVRLVSATDLIT